MSEYGEGRKITGLSAETMRAKAEVVLEQRSLDGRWLTVELANCILDLLDASAEEETNEQLRDMYFHLIPEGERES